MSDKSSTLNVYSVFDSAVSEFFAPFIVKNDSAALRIFAHAKEDTTTAVGLNAPDMVLYYIGTFDVIDGVLVPAPYIRPVSSGAASATPRHDG